jgi:hypothetical protein
MNVPRGTQFLQLGSTTLVLIAVALYQYTTAPKAVSPLRQGQHSLYQGYEGVLQLLYANQPMLAAEQLAALPKETVILERSILKDQTVPYAPEMLFLQLGTMFGRHANRAAFSGDSKKASVLLGACRELSNRLERGSQDETEQERRQRRQIHERLQRLTQRMNSAVDSLA